MNPTASVVLRRSLGEEQEHGTRVAHAQGGYLGREAEVGVRLARLRHDDALAVGRDDDRNAEELHRAQRLSVEAAVGRVVGGRGGGESVERGQQRIVLVERRAVRLPSLGGVPALEDDARRRLARLHHDGEETLSLRGLRGGVEHANTDLGDVGRAGDVARVVAAQTSPAPDAASSTSAATSAPLVSWDHRHLASPQLAAAHAGQRVGYAVETDGRLRGAA